MRFTVFALVALIVLGGIGLLTPSRVDGQLYTGTRGIVRTQGPQMTGNGRSSDPIRYVTGSALSIGELTATTNAGAHTLIESTADTNTAVVVANIRATSTGTSANGFGPQIGLQHDGAGATVPTTLWWLSAHRSGADNTGEYRGYGNVAGVTTHQVTQDSDGDLHILGSLFYGSPTAGTEYVRPTRLLTGGDGLAAIGDLSADRTLTVNTATANGTNITADVVTVDPSDGVDVDANGVALDLLANGGLEFTGVAGVGEVGVNVDAASGTSLDASGDVTIDLADATPGLELQASGLAVLYGSGAGNAAAGANTITLSSNVAGALTFTGNGTAIGANVAIGITPTFGVLAGNFVQGNQTGAITAGNGLAGDMAADALGDGFAASLSITDGANDGVTVGADGVTVNVAAANGTALTLDVVTVDPSDGIDVDANGVALDLLASGGLAFTGAAGSGEIGIDLQDASPGLQLGATGIGVIFGSGAGNAAEGDNTIGMNNIGGASFIFGAAPAVGAGGTQDITPTFGALAGNFTQGSNTLAIAAGNGLAGDLVATALGAGNIAVSLSVTDGANDGITVGADGNTVNAGAGLALVADQVDIGDGAGITVAADSISIADGANDGLTVGAGGLTVNAGAGVALVADNVDIGDGAGITVNADSIEIADAVGDGITVGAGGVSVTVAAAGGTAISGDAVAVDLRDATSPGLELAATGLGLLIPTNHAGGEIVATGYKADVSRLFAQTNSVTENDAVEGPLDGTGVGTLTIAANSMEVGDELIIEAWGQYTAGGSANTLNLEIMIGTQEVGETTAIDPPTQTAQQWHLRCSGTVRTVGGAGVGDILLNGYVDFENGNVIQRHHIQNTAVVAGALDWTAAQAVGIDATWSAVDSGESITAHQMNLKLVR